MNISTPPEMEDVRSNPETSPSNPSLMSNKDPLMN
jgi:hypothetical protein